MSNLGTTNEHGQGASHATQSSVPGKVQEKVKSISFTDLDIC